LLGAYWNASIDMTVSTSPSARPVCSNVPRWNLDRSARPTASARRRAVASPASAGSTPTSRAPLRHHPQARPSPAAGQVGQDAARRDSEKLDQALGLGEGEEADVGELEGNSPR
jgi:hypothetical protein